MSGSRASGCPSGQSRTWLLSDASAAATGRVGRRGRGKAVPSPISLLVCPLGPRALGPHPASVSLCLGPGLVLVPRPPSMAGPRCPRCSESPENTFPSVPWGPWCPLLFVLNRGGGWLGDCSESRAPARSPEAGRAPVRGGLWACDAVAGGPVALGLSPRATPWEASPPL